MHHAAFPPGHQNSVLCPLATARRCGRSPGGSWAGSVANTDLQFVVVQSPAKPWNTLLGGLLEFGKEGLVLVEGGLGLRKSILLSPGYRF
jgi:hypothetical protein